MSETKENKGYSLKLINDKVVEFELEQPTIKYDSQLQEAVERAMSGKAFAGAVHSDTGVKFDSNDTIFPQRSLTKIIEEVMLDWVPDNTSEMLFDVDTSFDPWCRDIEYYSGAFSGTPTTVGAGGSGVVNFVGYTENPTKQPTILTQLGYQYTWLAIQECIQTRKDLSGTLLQGAKQILNEFINRIQYGLDADSESLGVVGLFHTTGIARAITNGLTGQNGTISELANFNMLSGTGTQNKDFLMGVIDVPMNYTGKLSAQPNKLAMPIKQANKIRKQEVNDVNVGVVTVARYILENSSIDEIIAVPEFYNVNKNSIKDGLICYKKDKRLQVIKKQMPFTVFPVKQSFDNNFQGVCYEGTGGLHQLKQTIAMVKNCGTT